MGAVKMEALIILLALGFIIGLTVSIFKVNSYCEAKYGYRPYSAGNLFIFFLSVLIGVASIFFLDETNAVNDNVAVMVAAAALLFFLTVINIWRKTSFLIALHSIIAFPFMLIAIWLIVGTVIARLRGRM